MSSDEGIDALKQMFEAEAGESKRKAMGPETSRASKKARKKGPMPFLQNILETTGDLKDPKNKSLMQRVEAEIVLENSLKDKDEDEDEEEDYETDEDDEDKEEDKEAEETPPATPVPKSKKGKKKKGRKGHLPMHNILDVKRSSAKKKEKSAMGHFAHYIEDYYYGFMPDGCSMDPRLFECTGRNGKGMNYNFWDHMFGRFIYYLATYATKGRREGAPKISYETATGYASSVKCFYQNKFRNDQEIPVFKDVSWKNARFQLRKMFEERCRATGESMNNPHIASNDSEIQSFESYEVQSLIRLESLIRKCDY
jgi:hypothetical protein